MRDDLVDICDADAVTVRSEYVVMASPMPWTPAVTRTLRMNY
ncbi:hypothetical protein [Rhodococcus sp. NPDC057529]